MCKKPRMAFVVLFLYICKIINEYLAAVLTKVAKTTDIKGPVFR